MAQFLTPLSWHQTGPHTYVLDAPLVFESDVAHATITAPMGFPTDGESCPRCLPIINSLFGDCSNEGAVIHDLLYYANIVRRKKADLVLLEAMSLVPGMETWRKAGVYAGLRLMGWTAWRAHRKAHHSSADFPGVELWKPTI
jgi:hypothetical protein